MLEVGDWEESWVGVRPRKKERVSETLTSRLLGKGKRLGSSVPGYESALREDEQSLRNESRELAGGEKACDARGWQLRVFKNRALDSPVSRLLLPNSDSW